MENLVALRISLQHTILDPVVNHLHIVTRAWRTHVGIAIGRRQRLEDWLAEFESLRRCADHQAISVGEAPDPTARSGIDEVNSLRLQIGGTPHRIAIIRVSAVDDHIAFGQTRQQRCNSLFNRFACRYHDPDDARTLELGRDVAQTARSGCTLRNVALDFLSLASVDHHLVAALN